MRKGTEVIEVEGRTRAEGQVVTQDDRLEELHKQITSLEAARAVIENGQVYYRPQRQ